MVMLFALIGWVFLAVEAVVASPLIALGLAHPNSQQFFGASEPSIGMFLMLYLRPTLIGIGYIIASILAYLALLYLNAGIVLLLDSNLTVQVNGASLFEISKFFALILVYSYTAFIVIIQAYSFIGAFPIILASGLP